MSTLTGVEGEERSDYTREESRAIRARSLRLLGSLLRPVRARVALALAVIVVSTALQVAGPTLIALGIDQGLPALMKQHDVLPIALVVVAYLIAGVFGAVLIAQFTVLTARITQEILIDLRKRVFLHAQRLSLEFHESYTSGRIIARQTSDLEAIRELLDSGITGLVRGILYMVFIAIALVLLDPWSALVLAGALVPLFFLTRWFQKRSQMVFRTTRVFSAKLIVQFVETMTGIRAVKAFRKEKRNEAEYAEITEGYRGANARAIQLFGIFDPGLILIGNVTVAVVLLVGGFRVVSGALEIGALLAVVLYTRRFFDPLEEMAEFYNSYQSAAAALEKISGVLEEEPGVADPTDPVDLWQARGAVDFNDVRFAYHDDTVILPDFDLHIPAGQTIALVGSTGAGKSTLAKLMACCSTASTCGGCTPKTCDAPSSWSRRRRTCSAARWPRTSRSVSPTRASTRSGGRLGRWEPTGSSRPSRTATTPT
jgi:ATP-binding cassette subfamily B protein